MTVDEYDARRMSAVQAYERRTSGTPAPGHPGEHLAGCCAEPSSKMCKQARRLNHGQTVEPSAAQRLRELAPLSSCEGLPLRDALDSEKLDVVEQEDLPACATDGSSRSVLRQHFL